MKDIYVYDEEHEVYVKVSYESLKKLVKQEDEFLLKEKYLNQYVDYLEYQLRKKDIIIDRLLNIIEGGMKYE